MEITLIDAPEGVWYAPDIGDNREKPQDEQMRALIVPMLCRELQKLEEQGLRITRAGKLNIGQRLNRVREAILKKCVKEIRGLRLRDKQGAITEIKTVDALLTFAGHAMVDAILVDLFDAIKDHSLLEEGFEKKSEAPSAS